MAFEPLEPVDRLAALVPPPRFHTVRYHGVLASRSKHRAAVVPRDTASAVRPSCAVGTCVAMSAGLTPPATARAGHGTGKWIVLIEDSDE